MDLLFHNTCINIHISLFCIDHSLIKANLEKATIMMEEGGRFDQFFSDITKSYTNLRHL